MKTHTKKKLYRSRLQELAKQGKANDVDGKIINRSQMKDNSMRRDYYPQNLA